MNRAQLARDDWDALTAQVLEAVKVGFERRRQRLIGADGEGQIRKDLENAVGRGDMALNQGQLLSLLMQLPQGARASFDKRTHRRVWRRTTRLTYYFAAAHLLHDRQPEEITAEVLEHLQGAQAAMRYAWGRAEWVRIAAARPVDLDTTTQRGLASLLGEPRYQEISDQPLASVQGE